MSVASQQAAVGLPPSLSPARHDLRLLPDAAPSQTASAAAQWRRRSSARRRSTANSLRDPVIRAEILGVDPRDRASIAAAAGRPDAEMMSRYARRRPTALEQGDCPPSSMPFNYNDPAFLVAAQRVTANLHRYWINQSLGDVVLQTANGDLVAHRVVLASVSQSLDILFRQQRPDGPSTTAQLDLSDFTRDTVADVVNFAYAGELELDSRNIGPVTACACELDFDTVVAICRSYLLDQVDPDNIILHYSVAANNDFIEERDSLQTVLCEAFPETAS